MATLAAAEVLELVLTSAETADVLAAGDVIGEAATATAATAETSFITGTTEDVVAVAESYGGGVEAVGESSMEQVAEAAATAERI